MVMLYLEHSVMHELEFDISKTMQTSGQMRIFLLEIVSIFQLGPSVLHYLLQYALYHMTTHFVVSPVLGMSSQSHR